MDGFSDRLRWVGAVAWAAIGILVLAWAILQLLGYFRAIIPPLLVAIIFFVILHPAVTWLSDRGVRRHLGAALCFFLLLALLTGFGALTVPLVVDQTSELLNQLPTMLAGFQTELGGEAGRTAEELAGSLATWAGAPDGLLGAGRQVFAFAGSLIGTILAVVLGAVIAFYLVVDFPRLRRAGHILLPARFRPVSERLFEETLQSTTEFMRVRLLLALVVGVLGTMGFQLIGLPYWLLLGLILGATNIIPILGTYLGALPALLVALLTLGPVGVLWTLLVVAVAHAVDGYLLTPLLMHRHLDLHPIAVILAVLVGGAWYGAWGVLFAIPLLAAIRSFLGEYLRLRGHLREEEEVAVPLEAVGRS